MKETKSENSCHQEHVMILNSLTESLRDELKRGLSLMDTCVNQLAQAKWILINVEKTIEDAYATCPACDSSGRKKHDGHVPASPRTSVSNTNVAATPTNGTFGQDDGASAKKGSKPARKANVLPMVSGHTIQKPNINITRVEPKPPAPAKKSKKSETPTSSGSRNRTIGRGMGSALLASATAAAGSGYVPKDSDDEADKASLTSSRSRSKPTAESATEQELRDGEQVAVNLSDIHTELEGRMHIVGSDLVRLMESLGMPVDFKVKDRSKKIEEVELTSDKSDSDDDRSSDTKKKKSQKKRRDSATPSTSKKEETEKPSSALTFAALLQSRLKQVSKSTTKEALNNALSAVAKDDKAKSKDSDSDSKRSSKSPERKKVKYDSEDSDVEVTPKPSKRTSRKASSAAGSSKARLDSDDSDDDNTPLRSRRKPAGKKKKKQSDDDSDFEVESAKKSKSRSRSKPNVPAKKPASVSSGRYKSKEILSDTDDSSSSKGSSKVQKKKNAEPVWSSDSDANKKEKSAAHERNSDSPPAKPSASSRPGPASQKAKRTGSRPGPLSKKKLEENDAPKNDDDIDKDEENGEKPNSSNVENSPEDPKEGVIKIVSSRAIFSDSESDDSEIAKIKSSIPLNLQDAARSPSPVPLNSSSVFSRLLQAHNPSSSTWEKLRKRCTRVNSKVMELDEQLQEKLGKAGKLLKHYDGTFSAADAPFETGRYYIVGEPGDERLVLYERSELQVLDMDDEELNDLAN